MRIKSGLMYRKSTGKLVGFTELGDIGEELNQFERTVSGEKVAKRLATHVLRLMARGLVKHINYPIGYFSFCGFDGDQLYSSLWQGIGVLEMAGFKFDALVNDGASPNRRFYRIHKLADESNLSEDGVIHWMWNRFDKASKIDLFCDVPHSMKTLRNNLENSHGHNNTRNLMVRMKYKYNVLLFKVDVTYNTICNFRFSEKMFR